MGRDRKKQAYPIPTDNLAITDTQTHQILGAQQPKVPANGIHPHEVGVLGIPNADVPRDALCEAHARPVAENGRHVDHNVSAVIVE